MAARRPASPFEVTAKDVADLDDDVVVALMNLLLRAEARQYGLPLSAVNTTFRINDPDGGIDALTDTGAAQAGELLKGQIVWQSKKTWPGRGMKKKGSIQVELRKPDVQAAFAEGAGYALVVGSDTAVNYQKRRAGELREEAAKAGCRGPVRVLHASQISEWASRVPAAGLLIHPVIAGFQIAVRVLETRPHAATTFEPDAARRDTLSGIGDSLLGATATTTWVRLQGPAGVGKSRLALELTRECGIEELAVYCQQPPPDEFFGWVAARDGVYLTLIVDECDDAIATRLESLSEQCGGRLRLITVGHGTTGGENVFPLGPLDAEAMTRVVRSAAPGLRVEQAQWVADHTHGYVKLAVVAAKAVAAGQTDINALHNDRDVAEAITRLVAPAGGVEQEALQAISLFTRIGWEGEVANEGEAVARFLGVDWNRMRGALTGSLREGIVVIKGRYRYASPSLLAQWLAAEYWRANPGRIRELHDNLPSVGARQALIARLTELETVPGVGDVLELLLEDAAGPFEHLAALDDRSNAHLFHALAFGAPVAALRKLRKLIGDASDEALRSFRSGRLDVLSVLRLLLERRETFLDAARLVKRLAQNETESYSNNATGVWKSIFLTYLAPTEVSGPERLALLLEELITADSKADRRLALEAVAAALTVSELGLILRTQGPPPPAYWKPSVAEEQSYRRQALEALLRLRANSDDEVANQAVEVLAHSARALVSRGMAEDVIAAFEQVQPRSEKERRALWEAAMDVLHFAKALDPGARARFEGLAKRFLGDSLPDRIRRYAGSWTHVDWPDAEEPNRAGALVEDRIARLADEAVGSQDDLRQVLGWLFSGEAEQAYPFAYRLGQLDRDRRWLDDLVAAGRLGTDLRPLSAYVNGRGSEDVGWREALLDRWVDDSAMAEVVVDATWRGEVGDAGAHRILKLVDAGLVPTARLGLLQMGAWPVRLSDRTTADIAQRLLADGTPASVEAALSIAQRAGPVGAELLPVTWQLLEHPSALGSKGGMSSYYWKLVAARLVSLDPERVARAALRSIREGGNDTERLEVLSQALSAAPGPVWETIGEALLAKDRAADSIRIRWAFTEAGIVEQVPLDVLAAWLGRTGARGARAVAQCIRAAGDAPSAVVRLLLRDYAEEVGRILAGNFTTGVWWGSESGFLGERATDLEAWTQDSDPAVAKWARSLQDSLRARARVAASIEAEED